MKENILIVIPAYNPDHYLIKMVNELKTKDNTIIIIDDGSQQKDCFNAIKEDSIIITHRENKGKGYALKEGFKYILKQYPECIGVITADADGQHKVEDIQKIKNILKENTNEFIIGVRDFKQKQVPIKNKIGNYISNIVFYIKTKQKLKDTQSGLRGIPKNILEEILEVEGERYEYEINMLKYVVNKFYIRQVKINTVYDKTIKSHFKPIKSSIQIIKNILK